MSDQPKKPNPNADAEIQQLFEELPRPTWIEGKPILTQKGKVLIEQIERLFTHKESKKKEQK